MNVDVSSISMKKVVVVLVIFYLFLPTSRADLYTDDAEKRVVMTDEEMRSGVVSVRRSSGVLLTDGLLLTTAHSVQNLGSYSVHGGTFFLDPKTNDRFYFVLKEVIEQNEELDYAVAKISWKNNGLPDFMRYPRHLSFLAPTELNKYISADIYAMGAPWDKIPNGMRSNGSKFILLSDASLPASKILFNAGVIEGNSGGPLFRCENLLLGIVTGGPTSMRSGEYSGRDPNDPRSWNYATPIQEIYKVSPTLQSLYDENGAYRF